MKAKTQIIACVTEFVKAGDQSDVQALERVLHPRYQNVQDGFFAEKGLFQIAKAQYIQLVGNRTFGGNHRSIEIRDIEEFGKHMAVVEATLEGPGLIFRSRIVTVREKGAWQVLFNFPKILPKD